MFQDTSFDFQGSLAPGARDPATQFPSLVVFPPKLDNAAGTEETPLDWLDSLSFDDGKVLTADHGGSLTFTPKTSVNPYHNPPQLPYHRELYSALPSPAWSTTESGFSSPAYTLPSTPGTFYPTPVLSTQHLHPYHTHSSVPTQQSGGESSTFNPSHSPWAFPATILSSSAIAVTDATRYVTRDMHATRYERLRDPPSQPRFQPFSAPTIGTTHGAQETGPQLILYQPKPLRADVSAHHLLSYGLPTARTDVSDPHDGISYDTDGQLNGTTASSEGKESNDDMQYMASSTPTEKNFVCSHSGCSRAFTRPQDLARHKKTVHREGKQWVCCGVPMSEAHEYKISADAVNIGPMEHEGVLMIGGCGREYGRKDTYAKHLKSVRSRCVGDVDALYHCENMRKVLRFRMAKGRASQK
ncbi:hypothetical protein LXA43DRAFT_518920 [Ganoderma leucocontextum]|nr:hypothetical protein LXA43DRAFT_518920 [Ganoderma leucocontextum]